MPTANARPGIPRDNSELIRDYSAFIANEIRKRNRVTTNFEDVYQDVCTKLFEADVIAKFHERAAGEVPETMTLLEACVSLGITPENWRIHQSNFRYKRGYKWMPDSINGMGPNSRKAVFCTSDILKIDEMGHVWQNRGAVTPPRRPAATHYQFLNYLGTAIRNHFANFCRTRARKWQDRPGDMMPGKMLLGENVPQFRTADGGYNDHWTDTIRDDVAESRIEAQVDLSRVLDKLVARVPERELQVEILKHVQNGYTMVEAIKLSNLPPNKKRMLAKAFA